MILSELRKAKGYTQQFVAESVGVTQGTIYQWEKGMCSPRTETLVRLADLYGCTVDQLLGRENKEDT